MPNLSGLRHAVPWWYSQRPQYPAMRKHKVQWASNFYTRLVDLRARWVPVCGLNVNNKTFLSPDNCTGMSLSEEQRNQVNVIRQGSKCALTIVGVAKGKIRQKRLFLCFPAWAKKQMTDLTAGHLAELSFWSEPSCQVGSSCAWECGSLLYRNSRLWEVWCPHASKLGNPHYH